MAHISGNVKREKNVGNSHNIENYLYIYIINCYNNIKYL